MDRAWQWMQRMKVKLGLLPKFLVSAAEWVRVQFLEMGNRRKYWRRSTLYSLKPVFPPSRNSPTATH